MGISETIIAASIGAAATIAAGVFQLLTSQRPSKQDARPKRGGKVRSIAVIVALMTASAVSGFMYAELRNERTAEDLTALRAELNAQLQMLATTTQQLIDARAPSGAADSALPAASPMPSIASPAAPPVSEPGSVESVLYAHACAAGADCTEANSRPVALCGAIPLEMEARRFDLFIKGERDRDPARAEFGQDLGGAKFTGPPNEIPHGDNRKNVCVNFWHWSAEPHIATLVLHYGAPVDVGPAPVAQPAAASTATPMTNAQTVSLTAAKP